ncbi:MAG: hypothetical protein IJS00_00760 [Paludibacteraceae bacterium]|nr:hypothetical protein [Paludibacteraceae bacterium]
MLTALVMLFSANVFAETVATLADLQKAIDNTAVGGTVDITLTSDISIATTDKPIRIFAKYAEKGKTVNLDLNGHNIVASTTRVIELFKGTLNITGTGTIEKTAKGSYVDAILVAGSYNSTDANWSNLTIGKDVTVNAHGPQDASGKETTNGISVFEVGIYNAYSTTYYATEAGYTIEDVSAHIQNGNNGGGVTFSKATYFSNVDVDYTTYGKQPKTFNTTAVASGTYKGKYKIASHGTQFGYAYGVNIEVLGKVYGSKYGIKINGVIQTDQGDNTPYVHVASSAEVWSAPNSSNSTAIYSSGVGRFLIEGYVHGATGVYAKSGSVTLNDAVVVSDYTGDYHELVGQGSGIDGGGNAIAVESNKAYNGNIEVTIQGDTKVEGGSGYAIEETITTATDTKVSSVAIEGGTIEAGEQGGIIVEEATVNSEEGGKITIVGGNVEDVIEVKGENNEVTAVEITEFIPASDGNAYQTTSITDEETGKTTIVVTKFDSVEDMPQEANSVVEAEDETGIKWVSTADTEETLTENKTLTYLEAIGSNKQVLNVGDAEHNVELTIGRVVLGNNAQIVVAAGSTLIIDGEQGFVATKNSNIVLEMNPTTSSQFKYDPSVSSNRHPNATIKYTSQGYRDGATRVYQYFGMPFVSVDEFTTSSETYATQIDIWDRTKYNTIGVLNYDLVELSASYAIDYSKFQMFGFYRMNANNPQSELQTYTISGQLTGNENATMPLYIGWATLSNAYTAEMPVKAIEYANNERINNGSGVELAIYTYKQLGNSLIWQANNGLRRTTETLLPMQPFMLHNTGSYEEMTLNYETLVWDPVLIESAPARMAQQMTKATVRIQNAEGLSDIVTLAQADNFTAGKDMFDAEQYMNDDINIYVTDDKRMDIFATDNIQNTYIGITAAQGGTYTMSFEDVEGQDLVLIDLANNQTISIAEGQTYTFNVMDNEQSDYRFKVVGRQELPTDIEDVVKANNNSGIYTLTGVYVGEMNIWNNLPAGVYIVNGDKKIK